MGKLNTILSSDECVDKPFTPTMRRPGASETQHGALMNAALTTRT